MALPLLPCSVYGGELQFARDSYSCVKNKYLIVIAGMYVYLKCFAGVIFTKDKERYFIMQLKFLCDSFLFCSVVRKCPHNELCMWLCNNACLWICQCGWLFLVSGAFKTWQD